MYNIGIYFYYIYIIFKNIFMLFIYNYRLYVQL